MEFDKSRVYTALNADELRIGSKVYIGDSLYDLKKYVENGDTPRTLKSVGGEVDVRRFVTECVDGYYRGSLAYLVEEEFKQDDFEEAKSLVDGKRVWY